MLRSDKIALSPTADQALAFFRNCGYARFAFNFALSDFKEGLANGEWRSWKTLNNRFNARIVRSVQVIGIETLKVANLLKNRNVAKALSDAALGGLLTKIKAKAEQQGRDIVQVPQFFASSKTCSNCEQKKATLSL